MPDWRDTDDYEFKNLSPIYWAWEFLRRNGEYRRAWSEAIRLWRSVREDQGDETADWMLRVVAPAVRDPLDPAFGFGMDVLKEEFRTRYGLAGLANPETNRPTSPPFRRDLQFRVTLPSDFHRPLPPETLSTQTPHHVEVDLGESEVLAHFDLRFALEPQLRLCKEGLQLLQGRFHGQRGTRPTLRRRQPVKWKRYLRALDARESGASYEEMADVFFPLEDPDSDAYPLKQVDNLLQQAKRMLEPEYYRKIMLP